MRFLLLIAAAVLVLAACSSSSHPASSGTTGNPSVSSSVPSTTATSSTGSSVPTSSTSVVSGPQPCTASQLAGSLGSASGAAGKVYYTLTLRNTGSASCTLEGYPGVSFVSGTSQVGAAASHAPGTLTLIVLSPGGIAKAQLEIGEASNFGPGCRVTTVDGLRVYPPNQTSSLMVPHADQACSNTSDVTLQVGPLAVGSST